jgi:hypothetical protein
MKFNLSHLKFNKSTWYLISGMFIWAIYWGYTSYTYVLPKNIRSVEYLNEDCKESLQECAKYNSSELSRMMGYEIQVILAQIAFSLIVFWCFFVTFKYLYKFIKVGFINEFTWASLSLLKKTSIVLLGVFNVLVILVLYAFLNEHQKSTYVTSVPGYNVVVFAYPKNNISYVVAEGTWKNLDDYSKQSTFSKIQVSKIKCTKSENTCYEAIASAYKNTINIQLDEYQIINWTSDSVSFGEQNECSNKVNTINFVTKSVSQKYEYLQNAGCDTSLKNQYSQMVNGYDVYLSEREKLDSLITKFIKFVLNIREESDL